MSPSGRSVKAVRISRGARRTAAGGTSNVRSWASIAGAEQDLALAEDLDVARDEPDLRRPEHVAREHEVDRPFLEPEIAEKREIQRRRDGAEDGEVQELAVADLRAALTGWALRRAGDARASLQPAAQAEASDRGQERLGAGVPEIEVDRVARRGGEPHGRLAPERPVRQLTVKRGEGGSTAAESKRRGDRPDVEALGELPQRGDGELPLARHCPADPRQGRRQLDALGPRGAAPFAPW